MSSAPKRQREASPKKKEADAAGFLERFFKWFEHLPTYGKVLLVMLSVALIFIMMFLIIGDGGEPSKTKRG